jgi:hypothetical protein
MDKKKSFLCAEANLKINIFDPRSREYKFAALCFIVQTHIRIHDG